MTMDAVFCRNTTCHSNTKGKCCQNVLIIGKDGMCHIESCRMFKVELSDKMDREYLDTRSAKDAAKKISNYVIRMLIRKEK